MFFIKDRNMIRNYSIDKVTKDKLYLYCRNNKISYGAAIESLLIFLPKIKPLSPGRVILKAKESGIHNTSKFTFSLSVATYNILYNKATETKSSISSIIRELVKHLK
jgi:hypothetical protein